VTDLGIDDPGHSHKDALLPRLTPPLPHPLPDLLKGRQKIPEGLSLLFEPVITLPDLFLHQVLETAFKIGRRKLQVCFGFTAVPRKFGPSFSGDSDHGSVFRQRVNEQKSHAVIAGANDRPIEEKPAIAAPSCMLQHGNPKLGAGRRLGIRGERQMGHGYEFKVTIEDTKNFVTFKVNRRKVPLDLGIGRCKAKTQIAVIGHQRQQMLGNRSSMPRTKGPYRDNEALMRIFKIKRFSHALETVRAWSSAAGSGGRQ